MKQDTTKKTDNLAMCYQAVARTPEGRRVLDDLLSFCGWQSDLSATDQRVQDGNVARHTVAVRIHKMKTRKV